MDKRYYSTNQTRVGTFIGGPIAGIFFIYKNFLKLGKITESKYSLYYGIPICFGLFLLSPLITNGLLAILYPIAIAILAGYIVQETQISSYDDIHTDNFKYVPWWQVILISIGILVTTLLIIVVILFVAGKTGLINMFA